MHLPPQQMEVLRRCGGVAHLNIIFRGQLQETLQSGMQKLTYIGRKPSSSPAAGSHERHVHEQAEILARALNLSVADVVGKESSVAKLEVRPSDVEVTEGAPIAK